MCRLVSDRTERVPEIRNTPGHAQYGFRSPGRQKAQSKSHFALGGVSQLAAQISTFPAKKSAFARLEPPFVAQFVKNSVSAIILTAVSKEASCLFRKYSSLSLGGVLEWRAPCPMAPKKGSSTTKHTTRTLLRTRRSLLRYFYKYINIFVSYNIYSAQ